MDAFRSAGLVVLFVALGLGLGVTAVLMLPPNVSGELRENVLIVTVHGSIVSLFFLYYYPQREDAES